MSSNQDIHKVYQSDKYSPYYSIENGVSASFHLSGLAKPSEPITFTTNPDWTWNGPEHPRIIKVKRS